MDRAVCVAGGLKRRATNGMVEFPMSSLKNDEGGGRQPKIGSLSKKPVSIPHVSVSPSAALAPVTYPDARSFRQRFGLLVPATNTTMEHELWSIIFANPERDGLAGVGLHTSPVLTPRPDVSSAAGVEQYRLQFIGGVESAVKAALLAAPQYMIMGMSLEHIVSGIGPIRATMSQIEQYCDLSWATWHDAVQAALNCYGAKRIGLLTPFEQTGNESASRMFQDIGFEVAAHFGFACGNTQHIAHIPDWAKEKAVMEMVSERSLDAVVQCGTNMSMIDVTQKLEPIIDIPILGINQVVLWYALRESGFSGPLCGGGRLLREF
jgi:maleate isomerase